MSTPSPGDRPRRPFQHLSQRQGQPPDERRQQQRTGQRRDDLRHVEEELEQAQSELEQNDEPGEDTSAPPHDGGEIAPVPPVASRAVTPLAHSRTIKRLDLPAPS